MPYLLCDKSKQVGGSHARPWLKIHMLCHIATETTVVIQKGSRQESHPFLTWDVPSNCLSPQLLQPLGTVVERLLISDIIDKAQDVGLLPLHSKKGTLSALMKLMWSTASL